MNASPIQAATFIEALENATRAVATLAATKHAQARVDKVQQHVQDLLDALIDIDPTLTRRLLETGVPIAHPVWRTAKEQATPKYNTPPQRQPKPDDLVTTRNRRSTSPRRPQPTP